MASTAVEKLEKADQIGGFDMPTLEKNLASWNEAYSWPQAGDEWSESWGGVRAQWNGAIWPRIARWLPANKVLEIAPGKGRWTQFLLHHAVEYCGVDLSPQCVGSCTSRFASYSRCRFYVNDGASLDFIADNSIDFAFSFDSLVHAELDVVESYCTQLLTKLTPTGVAFIHHSNAMKEYDPENPDLHWRARSVSSDLVKDIVESKGGSMLVQEELNWGCAYRIDCFTTFSRSRFTNRPYRLILNDQFSEEMNLIRSYQSPYTC
jgi:SAM-dependent methyltransferase